MTGRFDWEKANRRDAVQSETTPPPIIAWWWTPSRGGRCVDCSELMPKDSRIAYNHAERSALCEICADARGLDPTPSKRWRRMAKA